MWSSVARSGGRTDVRLPTHRHSARASYPSLFQIRLTASLCTCISYEHSLCLILLIYRLNVYRSKTYHIPSTDTQFAMSSRIVPPQHGYPFYVTAKRYRFNGCEPQHPDALTLLLLHSTSFHKEIYEPTFDELALRLIRSAAVGAPKIKEAWVVECPNHGESAILNQELLKQPMYEDYCKS